MEPDIVVVGGGPVGCWTALQIKKSNPGLHVKIYERHPEYQRDHMLSIRRTSLKRYSKYAGNEQEAELFQKIAAAHNLTKGEASSTELPRVSYIRTLDFEKILKDHCNKLGIEIAYEKIEAPQQVMNRHPGCRLFVAADGAHSAMRTALLGKDSVKKKGHAALD